jgi:hypothetical protein
MMPYLSIKNCEIIHKNKTSQHKLVCYYYDYIDYDSCFSCSTDKMMMMMM